MTVIRKWVEIQNPTNLGHHVMVDATLLESGFGCIWHDGCQGAHHNGQAKDGCCSDGTMVRDTDWARIRAKVWQLTEDDWDNCPANGFGNKGDDYWSEQDDDGDRKTKVLVDKYTGITRCIMLNEDGGCALHKAALNRGESFIDWKPDPCWLYPLTADYDDNGNISTIRTFDQDEIGGTDLKWWCAHDKDAHGHYDEPMYVRYKAELTRLLGTTMYRELVEHFELDAELPPNTETYVEITVKASEEVAE